MNYIAAQSDMKRASVEKIGVAAMFVLVLLVFSTNMEISTNDIHISYG